MLSSEQITRKLDFLVLFTIIRLCADPRGNRMMPVLKRANDISLDIGLDQSIEFPQLENANGILLTGTVRKYVDRYPTILLFANVPQRHTSCRSKSMVTTSS